MVLLMSKTFSLTITISKAVEFEKEMDRIANTAKKKSQTPFKDGMNMSRKQKSC